MDNGRVTILLPLSREPAQIHLFFKCSSGLINGLIFLGEWSGFVPLYSLLLSQMQPPVPQPTPYLDGSASEELFKWF